MPKVKKKIKSSDIKQTPMMRQYLDIKAQYSDCVLFFRLGDFYEMFFEDAQLASKVLDIALTSRSKDKNGYPMCGVPYFSANSYIAKLVDNGHKVAVCDQVEDAKAAKGIVKRAVTRVVSPGMITDPEDLDFRKSNYLAGLYRQDDQTLGFAFLDVSTADFRMTQVAGLDALADEIARVGPRELLLSEQDLQSELGKWLADRFKDLFIKATDLSSDKERKGLDAFSHAIDPSDLATIAGSEKSPAAEAARLVFAYAAASLPGALDHVRRISYYDQVDHLVVDEYSRVNLELTRTLMEGNRRGSLLGVLDRTRSPMGSRMMGNWLRFPLLDLDEINARADAVEQLVNDEVLRSDLRDCLGSIRDMERLVSKIAIGQGGPRDLSALRDSLGALPQWAELLQRDEKDSALRMLLGKIDLLSDLHTELDRTLVDSPPMDLSNGGVVRQGVDDTLDELIHAATSGRDFIAALEQKERESTGISSLKIKYNKVFGYFIEVTKANLHLVPEHYRRKQTTANAERYETDELKEKEEMILSAQDRRVELEREIVLRLVESIRGSVQRILETASQVAVCDVIASLAQLAAEHGYCRPTVDDSEQIAIEEGRHPVVELLMKDEPFVPNDLLVDSEQQQLLIITGPNMAGKSTTIRQVALIAIMAQLGSFVPARSARIGLVDRIFTRIGAADNLARGQSTFMVEMVETAHILHHATRRSLLILDEIGRGTSTFDGLSIAWAVAEYVHDRIGARCLFATHYHQLSDLSLTKERVANFTISVKEWNDQIIFLRRMVKGITSRSYGIQVGKLAGLPAEVVNRAHEILQNLESQEFDEIGTPRLSRTKVNPDKNGPVQFNLFAAPSKSAIEEELGGLDLNSITPMDALNLLHKWKGDAK